MPTSLVPWHEYDGKDAERLLAALLIRTLPNAQRIDGAGGDDGVDVRVQVDGGWHIYEIKSFHSRLTSGQKRQIATSLTTAVQRQDSMTGWTLVLPLDLSPSEDRWFSGTLQAIASVPINWIGRTQIEESLSRNRDLLRAFAPGSAERRALDLLAQANAETSAMTRGMVDGIERIAALKDLMDLTDPDWAFDVSVAGDDVRIALRPKDADAPARSPIGISVEIDSANNLAVARQLEQFMLYGRPAEIPSESIISIKADLPGNLEEVISRGGHPALSIQKSDEEKGWRLAQRIDAVRDGRVIGTLPIEWDDRSQGPLGGTWLSGRDRSGFLELKMKTDPALKGGLEIRAPASDNVLPEDVVPVLKFLGLLRKGDSLRLVASGYPDVTARLTGQPAGHPGLPEAGIAVAEAIARIQLAVGVRFPLPGSWTPKEGEMIYFWDQLLATGQVQWYWPGYSVNLPAGKVAKLLSTSLLPRIAMTGTSFVDPVIELLGHSMQIQGQIRCEVTDMVIPNPRFLASQIRDVPPATLIVVTLAQDDRTKSMFYLDRSTEPAQTLGTSTT